MCVLLLLKHLELLKLMSKIACHLKEWQKYVNLSLAFPSEGALKYGLALYSSNNRPQSQLLILPEDLLIRSWYHCGHQNVHQCSPLVHLYQHSLLRGDQQCSSPELLGQIDLKLL